MENCWSPIKETHQGKIVCPLGMGDKKLAKAKYFTALAYI